MRGGLRLCVCVCVAGCLYVCVFVCSGVCVGLEWFSLNLKASFEKDGTAGDHGICATHISSFSSDYLTVVSPHMVPENNCLRVCGWNNVYVCVCV